MLACADLLARARDCLVMRLSHLDETSRIKRLRPVIRSVDMNARRGRETYMLGWRVIGKRTRTKRSGEAMAFITFSDEWGRFEATFFPKSFERNALELKKGYGPFLLKGHIDMEFGVPTLIAEHVKLMTQIQPIVRSTYGSVRQTRSSAASEARKQIYSIS